MKTLWLLGIEDSVTSKVTAFSWQQKHFRLIFPTQGSNPGLPHGRWILYLMAQLVKNPPAMWETWVQSLGWEKPQRRERLPTPVFWPWEFWPWEFHGLYSPWGRKESDMTEQLSLTQWCWSDSYGISDDIFKKWKKSGVEKQVEITV